MEKLREVDPVIAQKFHPNDTRRLRRALEIYFKTGKRASELYDEQQHGDQSSLSLRYPRSLVLWIWSDQKALDARLDARVDQMLANGLYDEINEMYQKYDSDTIDLERGVWQVIGFRQFLPWLTGQDATPDKGIEQMKAVTRKYAKKQTKWILKKLLFMMNQVEGGLDNNVALLNATDLSQWSTEVNQRGVSIASDFLHGTAYRAPLAPPGLESMLNLRTTDESFHKEKWKHFECDSCKDKEGNFMVFVGEDAWNTHVRGRKHRAVVRKLSKQAERTWEENRGEQGENHESE